MAKSKRTEVPLLKSPEFECRGCSNVLSRCQCEKASTAGEVVRSVLFVIAGAFMGWALTTVAHLDDVRQARAEVRCDYTGGDVVKDVDGDFICVNAEVIIGGNVLTGHTWSHGK